MATHNTARGKLDQALRGLRHRLARWTGASTHRAT